MIIRKIEKLKLEQKEIMDIKTMPGTFHHAGLCLGNPRHLSSQQRIQPQTPVFCFPSGSRISLL